MKLKYLKPSGIEMEVNDTPEIRAYAAQLGWKPVCDEPELKPEVKKGKGRQSGKTIVEQESVKKLDTE